MLPFWCFRFQEEAHQSDETKRGSKTCAAKNPLLVVLQPVENSFQRSGFVQYAIPAETFPPSIVLSRDGRTFSDALDFGARCLAIAPAGLLYPTLNYRWIRCETFQTRHNAGNHLPGQPMQFFYGACG